MTAKRACATPILLPAFECCRTRQPQSKRGHGGRLRRRRCQEPNVVSAACEVGADDLAPIIDPPSNGYAGGRWVGNGGEDSALGAHDLARTINPVS